MDAADVERRLVRIELVIVGDHQRVAVPSLVLKADCPVGSLLIAPSDVWTRELNVFPMGRNLHAKLLHALIDDAISNGCASTDEAVADGREVEDFGNDARGHPFRRQLQGPIRLIRDEAKRCRAPVSECGGGNFAQTGQFGGLELNARRRRRTNLGCLPGGSVHEQGSQRDLIGKCLLRLFQLNLNLPLAEDPAAEIDPELSVARRPILDATSAHVGDDKVIQWRKFDCIDPGLFHRQHHMMGKNQARLFEPGRDL